MNSLQDRAVEAGHKLEQRLMREIESGELAPGAPILSTPKLAKQADLFR